VIALALGALLSIYVLWIFYLAVMNLQRSRDAGTLTRPAYYLGLPILYIGLAIDAFVNVFILTWMFLDLPREPLVTARLSRYAAGSNGWRKTLALWYAVNLLDTFDPSGKHIRT
jgi:hypothetical protein